MANFLKQAWNVAGRLLWVACAVIGGMLWVPSEAAAAPAGRERAAAMFLDGCCCVTLPDSGCCCETSTPIRLHSEHIPSSEDSGQAVAAVGSAAPRGTCECRASDPMHAALYSTPRVPDGPPKAHDGVASATRSLACAGARGRLDRPTPAASGPSKSPLYLRIARLLI